jgi:hypothetical protein
MIRRLTDVGISDRRANDGCGNKENVHGWLCSLLSRLRTRQSPFSLGDIRTLGTPIAFGVTIGLGSRRKSAGAAIGCVDVCKKNARHCIHLSTFSETDDSETKVSSRH